MNWWEINESESEGNYTHTNIKEKSLKEEIRERVTFDYQNSLQNFISETDTLYNKKFNNIKTKKDDCISKISNEESALLLEQKNLEKYLISIQNKRNELEGFYSKTQQILSDDRERRLEFAKHTLQSEVNAAQHQTQHRYRTARHSTATTQYHTQRRKQGHGT